MTAYKHILKANKNKPLTPDEKKRLMNNLAGYDISPDMVKLSLVNMYLHGFPSPNIHEYDTLTSDEKWNERFDIMMANPPFMTPKGGIRPHKRFMVQANRAEVLFVDYIMEHLNNKGRAGIIVPEGVIFTAANAYKHLRKLLVEDGLYAVVSLPAGVFNPYSGVKTSILFFDNQFAKQSNEVLFIKVLNDGFDLGAQRRPVDRNDLPYAVEVLNAQHKTVKSGKKNPLIKKGSAFAWTAPKAEIIKSGNCNLSGERYRSVADYTNAKWQMVELGEVLDYEQPTKYIVSSVDYDDSYTTPVLTAGKTFILGYTNEKEGIFKEKLPVIIFDDFTTATKFVNFPFKVKSSAMKILHAKKDKADIRFLFYVIQKIKFVINEHKRYWISQYSKIKIPLPPLEIQEQIISELDNYQKVIDGAKQIINNYKPLIKIESNWDTVEIESICKLVRGSSPRPQGDRRYYGGKVPRLMISDVTRDRMYVTPKTDFLTEEGAKLSRPMKKGEVVMAVSGNPGLPSILKIDACIHDGFVGFRKLSKEVLPEFLYYVFLYQKVINNSQSIGAVFKNLTTDQIKKLKIPLPSVEIQQQVIAKLKEEQKQIESTKAIASLFEEKIKYKIAEVWRE